MAYHPASVIDLYICTKFHSNWRNFLWTDGRTDGRTDIFSLYVIRSTLGSRPNNNNKHFTRFLTNITNACAATRHHGLHICQSKQKWFQHLPEGFQCDCRITKCSGFSVPKCWSRNDKGTWTMDQRVTVHVSGHSRVKNWVREIPTCQKFIFL